MTKVPDELVDALTRKLVDEGKLVEAGWVSLAKAIGIRQVTHPVQYDEMRKAFFAGAQHIFGSIMSILDEGEEATEDDLRRMDQIQEELTKFGEDFVASLPAEGRG